MQYSHFASTATCLIDSIRTLLMVVNEMSSPTAREPGRAEFPTAVALALDSKPKLAVVTPDAATFTAFALEFTRSRIRVGDVVLDTTWITLVGANAVSVMTNGGTLVLLEEMMN